MIFRILFVSVLLIFQSALADTAEDKAEFKRLYAQFNDLYENTVDTAPLIEVGEKLYKLAPKAYGENHNNTAVVTYNLASIYDEKGKSGRNDDEKKAIKLYKEFFKISDKLDVAKDRAYLKQYIQYVTAIVNVEHVSSRSGDIKKISSLAKALELTPMERANYHFSTAFLYFKAGRRSASLSNFEDAISIYEQEKGPDYIQIGQSLFWMAKIEMAKKKRETAESHFLKVLDIYNKNGLSDHEVNLSTHAFLVTLYEDMGQSEQSTKHCVAIGMERKKEFDIFEEPIYRKPPKYPSSAARLGKEAKVLVEFTVDKDGITRDIKIVESDNSSFNNNTIKAVEKFRFAPRVEDGELVETHGVRNMIQFVLTR